MTKLTASVVIPAYNCSKTIDQALKAVLSQSLSAQEVIVVDDGSTDDTAQRIKQHNSIKYIYQKNSGPAQARNAGAQSANADIVLFTDSDCIPDKNWVKGIISNFNNDKHGVVMGSYGIANQGSLLARCIHKEILYRHHHLMPDYPKVFGSYNFGIRKNIFDKVGGFDQNYSAASGEDNDLSYKVRKAGYDIFFAKDSLVNHFHPEKVGRYLKEQYRHGFWRVKMYFEHPQMMKGDDYTYWKDIVEMPLVGICILSFFLMLAQIPFAAVIFASSFLALGLLELCVSYVTCKNGFETIFFSFVTFLRAFARFFGFSTGTLHFLTKKRAKKSK